MYLFDETRLGQRIHTESAARFADCALGDEGVVAIGQRELELDNGLDDVSAAVAFLSMLAPGGTDHQIARSRRARSFATSEQDRSAGSVLHAEPSSGEIGGT
jgi:hypothetical protein